MVGAAGIVASTINNRHQRRTSQHGDVPSDNHGYNCGRHGSKATISESVGTRVVPPPPSACFPPGGGANNKEPEIIPEKMSMKEKVKFYVSLVLGIVASICIFALLFLIPLVVEPSISTLLADFDPEPAVCVTSDYTYAIGLSKCGAWSSCREGCTSAPFQCHQISVAYRRPNKHGYAPLQNFTIIPPDAINDVKAWDIMSTPLLINTKGCGYPPRVQCDAFGEIYSDVGRVFPCYYSRANPLLVVTEYDWKETAYPLIFSLGIPTTLFAVSISVLSFWYCPSCEERGKNKRPCRSRYHSARMNDTLLQNMRSLKELGSKSPKGHRGREDNEGERSQSPSRDDGSSGGKHDKYLPSSPSLATISSRDTNLSSISSLNDGWQSPPSPTPRHSARMNESILYFTTRSRKL